MFDYWSERRAARPQQPAWPTFVRAMGLVRSHRVLLIAFLGATTAASLVGLFPPLLIRSIIDDALPHQDSALLNELILIMLGIIIAGALNGVLQSFLNNSISEAVMFDLRNQLFRRLTTMPLSWFTANRTGDTLSRVSNDVGSIQGVIGDTFGSIVGNVITLGSTFILMLALDWRLAVATVLLIPVFVIPARRVGNVQRALRHATQEHMAALNSQMQETLSVSGALLMKTFGRRNDEADRFEKTAAQIRDLNVRRAMIGRWFLMAMGLFGSIGPAVVYWWGGHQVIGGHASLGTVVALAALLPRLFGPAASLLGVNVTVLSSLALFERIFDYLDLTPDIRDKEGAVNLAAVQGTVELRDVSFEYIKGQPVLDGVSLHIPAGHFAALVGATGAGKTTIAYLVARLYDVTDGAVLLDGHDVRDVTLDSLGRALGMVNQEPFLFHSTIRENLRYGRPDASNEEVEAAARAANIYDFIANLPDGLETVVGERGYRLSGGEKQRVAIARAILKDPSILILDEATSSIDAITERSIQDALAYVTRGRTVLAIAHRLSTIMAADVIFVISEGRVVESGTHTELLAANGAYARLFEQQFSASDSGVLAADYSRLPRVPNQHD